MQFLRGFSADFSAVSVFIFGHSIFFSACSVSETLKGLFLLFAGPLIAPFIKIMDICCVDEERDGQ